MLTPVRQPDNYLKIAPVHPCIYMLLIHITNETFFLIVYNQAYIKVRLFVGFKVFKTIFQVKKQSITMFQCLRLGTILLVRQ